MLLFQSDLCSVLLDELERRHADSQRLKLHFHSKIDKVSMMMMMDQEDGEGQSQDDDARTAVYDLVIGCDGVRSKVRESMMSLAPPNTIQTFMKEIPGVAKVMTVETPSSNRLDPESVHLILPKGTAAGAISAFVEPTIKGACILFAGRVSNNDDDRPQILASSAADIPNAGAELGPAMRQSFPLLADRLTDDVVDQLAKKDGFSSNAVKCNIYHCGLMALCGDAAHATGGVSGQGCNSALMDASVLADTLEQAFHAANPNDHNKAATIKSALLQYSQRQVPEGTALFELSIGPDGGVSTVKRLLSGVSALFDFVFKDKSTIQRVLGTSLKPFSEIRREREMLFDEPFPTQDEFMQKLVRMDKEMSTPADKVSVHFTSKQ